MFKTNNFDVEDSEADENSKSSDDGIDWDTVDKYAALSIYSDSSSMGSPSILSEISIESMLSPSDCGYCSNF
jgi:hypothetical protein